jgi:hypothetical protein
MTVTENRHRSYHGDREIARLNGGCLFDIKRLYWTTRFTKLIGLTAIYACAGTE